MVEELAALRALRAALPAPYELRLDANGAWTPSEARARLGALADLEVTFVEQPVAADQLLQLGPCATPWAADESLAMPGMVEALLDDPAARRSCSSRRGSGCSMRWGSPGAPWRAARAWWSPTSSMDRRRWRRR
ncbi:MAG: enolase C-terminal domain-like protein [Polyangiaceae bacterium]